MNSSLPTNGFLGPVYVIGCGAVGIPLAASLIRSGLPAIAVRTREENALEETVSISITMHGKTSNLPIRTTGISNLRDVDSPIVIATKAHANEAVARRLVDAGVRAPLVIMQNGLGVERPFLDAGFDEIYRCVLYIVSEGDLQKGFQFNPVSPSPIGIVKGSQEQFDRCVTSLNTADFPLRIESDIRVEVWTKTIINSVFNAICPLLDADNSLFSRDEAARLLAKELIRESTSLANRLGIGLDENVLFERVLLISSNSTQAISTLQDLRAGRETEIEFLNLELARIGASMQPPAALPRTECLGRMVEMKSRLGGLHA